MGSKKKDLEIIYNLQWKSKSGNGGDKANIIGMYDIPATTLNWEIFKSYLLKNSGTVGDDVKVSYITDSNREFPIESQTDFQIALYAFRRKARMGDIVNLKLDRISDQPSHKNSRHSNDVETQFDNEAVSIVSSCCNSDSPPEWFITYMNKFKKNISEEITAAVSNGVSSIKPHSVSQPACYHSRKSKAENSKRRKLPLLAGDGLHESPKEFIKSLKLESKLEHKLEKLESKGKKLKEKSMSLFSKSSDSDVGNWRRSTIPCENGDILDMDATPVNTQEMVPHMLGGEIYLHQWKVINSGKSTWTKETALMFTWGSKALRPLDTIVSVPHLKAGETGTVSVRLQIPNQPGQYECYFHFHHKSRRFGHWLGCQIIVDPFDLKGNKSVLETSTAYIPLRNMPPTSEYIGNISDPVTRYGDIWQGTSVGSEPCTFKPTYSYNIDEKSKDEVVSNKAEVFGDETHPSVITVDKVVRELSSRVEDIKLQDPTDTNCSSDSDNQSIISLSESNSSKGLPSEYVVVPIPNCFQLEDRVPAEATPLNVKNENTSEDLLQITNSDVSKTGNSLENFDDNNNEDTKQDIETDGATEEHVVNTSNKSDIVMVSLMRSNEGSEEFAYVIVDGQKVMIPKKMIKSEYLQSAENVENDSDKQSRSSSFASVSLPEQKKEEAPELNLNIESKPESQSHDEYADPMNFEENDFNSHCSAAGSCFSDATDRRVFMFPQACPGFEVIPGNNPADIEGEGEGYRWSKSSTQYAFTIENSKEPLIPSTSDPVPVPVPSSNPFTAEPLAHTPNYQQTPPEERRAPTEEEMKAAFQKEEFAQFPPQVPVRSISSETSARQEATPEPSAPLPERVSEGTGTPPVVHILPEALVRGAASAVSSVARSVINRIVPQGSPGRWENGHWVSTNPDTPREANLQALAEMGFWNRDLNATLLARYNDDLSRVVAELVQ